MTDRKRDSIYQTRAEVEEQRRVREWLNSEQITDERQDDFFDRPPERWFQLSGNEFDNQWNIWAAGHVDVARREIRQIAKVVLDESGAAIGRLARRVDNLAAKQNSDDLRSEIERLKNTLAEVLGEIRDLWAAVEAGDGNTRSNIVPILRLKGRADAA
jgi:hypothetical protein